MLNFRWLHLPYCFKHLGNGYYVVLNRNYKPLGFANNDHYDDACVPTASKKNMDVYLERIRKLADVDFKR